MGNVDLFLLSIKGVMSKDYYIGGQNPNFTLSSLIINPMQKLLITLTPSVLLFSLPSFLLPLFLFNSSSFFLMFPFLFICHPSSLLHFFPLLSLPLFLLSLPLFLLSSLCLLSLPFLFLFYSLNLHLTWNMGFWLPVLSKSVSRGNG